MKKYFIKGQKKGRRIASRRCENELKASLIGVEEEIPKGHLAVYVGVSMRRFVIPTAYLCSSEFDHMLKMVEEEFDYNQKGGLTIPCEEEDFEKTLKILDEAGRNGRRKKKKAREFESKRWCWGNQSR